VLNPVDNELTFDVTVLKPIETEVDSELTLEFTVLRPVESEFTLLDAVLRPEDIELDTVKS
jgi:hypothetical protein